MELTVTTQARTQTYAWMIHRYMCRKQWNNSKSSLNGPLLYLRKGREFIRPLHCDLQDLLYLMDQLTLFRYDVPFLYHGSTYHVNSFLCHCSSKSFRNWLKRRVTQPKQCLMTRLDHHPPLPHFTFGHKWIQHSTLNVTQTLKVFRVIFIL
jgi:hypothetical protein